VSVIEWITDAAADLARGALVRHSRLGDRVEHTLDDLADHARR
jgi:hypothetical protein